MSGYFRMSADEWEPEHYKGRWTPENRAPRWWAWADASWYIDRRRLPAARKLSEEWGWTKSTAYAFARSVAIEQRGWESRPEVRTYLDGLISPDKTRTRTAELRGHDSDTRGASNADKSATARTDSGHFSDTSRTVLGHLTGARSEPSSSASSSASSSSDLNTAPAPADAPIAAHPEAVPREQPPEAATAPTTRPDPRPAPSVAPVAPTERGNGATSTALATRKTDKPKVWGYADAIAVWNDEHARILHTAYPWQWKGHKADPPRIKVWIDTARVTEHDLDGGIARIRTAVRAYLGAVDAGTAWPIGDPASTHHFTREIAKWLQIAPGSRPAPGASRAPTKTESLLRHIQKRLQESTNAE